MLNFLSQLEKFSESSPLKHKKLNVKCSIIVVLRSSVMLNVHRWRNKTSLKSWYRYGSRAGVGNLRPTYYGRCQQFSKNKSPWVKLRFTNQSVNMIFVMKKALHQSDLNMKYSPNLSIFVMEIMWPPFTQKSMGCGPLVKKVAHPCSRESFNRTQSAK